MIRYHKKSRNNISYFLDLTIAKNILYFIITLHQDLGSFEREETGGGRLHFSLKISAKLLNHLSNQLQKGKILRLYLSSLLPCGASGASWNADILFIKL